MTQRCIVYHGLETGPEAFGNWTGVDWRPADDLLAMGSHRRDAEVLVLDASNLERVGDVRDLPHTIVIIAADRPATELLGERVYASLADVHDTAKWSRVLRATCKYAVARRISRRRKRQLAQTHLELHELKRISIALGQERSLSALLREILNQGKRLTESDGGCLFLHDKDAADVPYLEVAMLAADSLPGIPRIEGLRIPVDDSSIIGHAAVSGKSVNVADAYQLPPDAGFRQNPLFDEQYGYRRRSMLVIPMIDRLDRPVGVLVFVNRKSDPNAIIGTKEDADRYVLRYTGRQLRLARALAAQAAVAIETVRLYVKIENIFESFVKASVAAIDERDPATAGHSIRVAMRALDLAAVVEKEEHGKYRDMDFTREQLRELKFAALLHDFGKIGVREEVLVKAKKLPPVLWERVDSRFDVIRLAMEVEYFKRRASLQQQDAQQLARLEEEFVKQVEQLSRQRDIVRAANEPAVLDQPTSSELDDIARQTFELPDRGKVPYLSSEELHYLQITKGSLDERERSEIQSHAEQSYRFLSQVPWTEGLKDLPTYAYTHHERLNGAGYPRHLEGDQISVQSRLLSISDVFDALTESDRPYKPAVPRDKALEIIQSEANAGLLDAELVRIMIDSQCFGPIKEEDWRRF